METIPELFAYSVENYGDLTRFGEKKNGEWITYTFKETRDMIEKITLGLNSLGFKHGDRFAILSENSKEWTMTDLACAHLGLVSVAVYPTLPANQVQYIMDHSGASGVVCSDKVQLAKLKEIKKDLPELKFAVCIEDGQADEDWILSFSDLLKKR